MNKSGILQTVFGVLHDIAIAGLVVVVVLGVLYSYSGVWPPLVVIESSSMSHGEDSRIGIIDAGDIVIVKEISGPEDIITYVKGRTIGYKTYGSYGDVIVYKKYGSDAGIPVIHRAVVWLKYNGYGYDVPELKLKNPSTIRIEDYGPKHLTLQISLSQILKRFQEKQKTPHDGFLTMGDNNLNYDQELASANPIVDEPVAIGWIIGVAKGELPWFGAIKLALGGNAQPVPHNSWYLLFLTVAFIILLPFIVEYLYGCWKKIRCKKL